MSLFRAVTLKLPWQPDDLLATSNWLQLKTAAGTNIEAIEVLAESGRTKRIRNTARTVLDRPARTELNSVHPQLLTTPLRAVAINPRRIATTLRNHVGGDRARRHQP
ncbi:hypothetical protein [Streptomyces sp. NPDC016845]|uniref:hypothetical protein n=1 Tax=Streptomyces sp. NPDC016845 TaxID=3364972 RepID=UPI0037A8CC38